MTKQSAPQDSAIPRRQSLRLPQYDYATPGAYFVTVCTAGRICRFGNIENDLMQPNELGKLVEACWYDLPLHYPHVELDAFILMPNHVHGILRLVNDPATNRSKKTASKRHCLSEIVRAFKTFSARRINESRATTGRRVWQRGYYEHVIRNDTSLDRIRRYIDTNSQRWAHDRENPANPSIRKGGFETRPYNDQSADSPLQQQ